MGRRLVLIDGWAGSGKSTLARSLAQALDRGADAGPTGVGPAIISLDDLYEGWSGPSDERFAAHLESWIALPLRHGLAVRHPVYDWAEDAFTSWSAPVDAAVVIVEGVGALHPVLARVASVRVWVEADADTRRSRVASRPGPPVHSWWERWHRVEQEYRSGHDPCARADTVVDNSCTGESIGP
jgi:uridine kinase